MMEAVRTSETSICSNETTQCYIPEGYNVHTRSRENLKSQNAHRGWSSASSQANVGMVSSLVTDIIPEVIFSTSLI
jgi:hypothetical protein